jgi:hypothetical protein
MGLFGASESHEADLSFRSTKYCYYFDIKRDPEKYCDDMQYPTDGNNNNYYDKNLQIRLR